MMTVIKKFPHLLLALYSLYFICLAIHPYHRGYWLAANIAPILITALFVLGFRYFQFSNFSYFLAAFLLFFQTLGAHYFFYRVPFEFITDLFDFSRHNFDRMVHVAVGFYAYPIAEFIKRKKIVTSQKAVYIFSFTLIMASAGLYEIFEWLYVILVSPNSTADFLGAQGDIWDAQKDMLADGIGAAIILGLFYLKSLPFFSRKP